MGPDALQIGAGLAQNPPNLKSHPQMLNRQSDNDPAGGGVSPRPTGPGPEGKKPRFTPGSPMPSAETPEEEEEHLPRIGTLARTRRLLMAALRVWELKRGIRD